MVNETLEAFRRWRSSSATLLPGTGGPTFEANCQFIPRPKLEEYFKKPNQLENLLTAVLDPKQSHAVDANYVRSYYSLSFAILLCIGEGHMIHHFQQYQSLRDEKLPHNSRPDDFPTMTPDQYEKFADVQRQFCSPNLEYSMNSRYKEKDILPIISKEKIGEGGSAIVYKIVVAEGYNSLRPQSQSKPFHPEHNNTFVLKTYRPAEAEECYKAERDAYMKLRWGAKPSPYIVTYYGGFIHGNSYNIILEYADRGTLEDFMKETDQPASVEDNLRFWDRLSGITHGLLTIHGNTGAANSAYQFLNGCHQDIKPHNILVFTKTKRSPYDCQFKIADLALTQFKSGNSGPNDPPELDAFGARAYGAPETYRSRGEIESAPLPITPAVDIWSVGCVFSEAAVWTQYGWRKVIEYRNQRSLEIKHKGGADGEQLFHYGGRLLDAVVNIHKDIQRKTLTRNHITRVLLEHLVSDMLLHGDRIHAKLLFEKSKRLIEADAVQFGVPISELNGEATGELGESNGASHLQSVGSQGVTAATLEMFKGPHGERKLPPWQSQWEPHPPDEDSAPSSSSSEIQQYSRTQHYKSASQGGGCASIDAVVTSQPGRQPSPINSNPPPRGAVAKTDEESGVQRPEHPEDELKRPALSLDEGHEWKRKKKNHEYAVLPGAENLTYLHGRDHIFVVDNSATMQQYRREMTKVVELLAYMLKSLDEDGLDIYFTQSPTKINSSKSTNLVRSIYQVPFQGATDMAGRLQQIMHGHIKMLGILTYVQKPFYRRQPAATPQKPWSIYILTDAKWQPTDVGGFIKKLVDTMREKNCSKEHVAIQFIRFGNDRASINKLNELDSGLGLKAGGMDIVDHTYWNDNVWKMLLGGINDWYDDDPS